MKCYLQSVARFIALFNGQESWAMSYITQGKKCNVVKLSVSHMRSSYNCKIDSIHQTDSIVATRACAVATKRKTPFFFTFKGLSNSLIFQYLNFSFHGHFKMKFKTQCFGSWIIERGIFMCSTLVSSIH